jgi:hypothetical protein
MKKTIRIPHTHENMLKLVSEPCEVAESTYKSQLHLYIAAINIVDMK